MASLSWPRTDVLQACRTYGPLVDPIEGIDGSQLLAAMAMNESSLGDDCDPLYQQTYDEGGIYSHDPHQMFLLSQYGRDAAMSYGPWQIMLVNAVGFTPAELSGNLASSARATISFLNHQIRAQQPKTVAEIGQLWNGGHVGADNEDVQKYVARLKSNYEAAAMWLDKG